MDASDHGLQAVYNCAGPSGLTHVRERAFCASFSIPWQLADGRGPTEGVVRVAIILCSVYYRCETALDLILYWPIRLEARSMAR